MKEIIKKIRETKIKYVVVAAFIMILGITLGTAILTRTLNINGKTKIEKNSWIIYFDDVRKSSDSVASEKDARIVDYGKTRIEFEANLKGAGDFYEFTVYTVNDGSIDAMVDSIEKSTLSEEQLKYIDFKVTYDNGEEIRRCDALNAGTRRRIKAIVKYKDGLDMSEYPTDDVNLNLYFNINYVQKDKACPPRELDEDNVLTIIPNGGKYNGRTDEIRIYMKENETYTISTPTRALYNFTGWEITPEEGTYSIENNVFTMGKESVTLKATWEEGDYVARIMNTYFPTIQEALDRAKKSDWLDNTVYLLKDTSENPVNNTSDEIVFNLGGHKVTGTFTNSSVGKLTVINGVFENLEDNAITFKNYGRLTMGKDDGDVQVESSITINGEEVGLQNYEGSSFYIYDGYLEAKHALVGGYTGKAEGYYVIVDYRKAIKKDRVYLVKNNNRAVAKTITNGELYYYNLQSAIEEVEGNKKDNELLTDLDYIIYAIRNFEGAYELEVEEGSRIYFDTVGYNIDLGENIKNNGYFKVYNSTDNLSTIRVSKTITNSNELEIDKIILSATADSNIVNNTGKIKVSKTTMHSKYGNAINNSGNGEVSLDKDTLLQSDDAYALYNTGSKLKIENGTIYGLYNNGQVEITGGEFVTYKDKTQNEYYTRYTNGIYNDGTITMRGGKVNNTTDTNPIINRGTLNYYDGELESSTTLIQNSNGTVNVLGSEINTEGVVITNGSINVNGGKVKSSQNAAITGSSNVTITTGEVKSETSSAINISGTVTVNGGLVEGKTNGITTSTFRITAGEVRSEGTGVVTSNAEISGGKVKSTGNGVTTSNISMTGGEIESVENTGLIINNSGTILGGLIKGDIYGAESKGSITLGKNDGEISITSPEIIGKSYGLYLEGNDNNFYDGILKGQIDGYKEKTFTGLPLGGYVADGEEDIDGEHYETDYVSVKENWLRVGETEYNSINAASEAIEENGIIEVIKDVEVNFEQEFKNSETKKNIIFDLKGHTISTTQNITNKANISVTMKDSSEEKSGSIEFKAKTGLINNGELIIESGLYKGSTEYIITNNSGMRVTGGKIQTERNGIRNNSELSIEGGQIQAVMGVNNDGGKVQMGGGEITAREYGIRYGTVEMENGNIHSGYRGISDASIYIKDGEVHAKDHALYSYWQEIKVDNGNIESEENTAIKGHHKITINNGQIVGIRGIENDSWYDGVWSHYEDIIINDGNIKGTDGEGIIARGGSNKLEVNNGQIGGTTYGILNNTNTYVYDGLIEGGTYGILNRSELEVGKDDKNISTTNPVITGGTYGVYNDDEGHDTRFRFYDGILKGLEKGHYGLVTKIPDASMVVEDYEFINRVEYQTEYLGEQADFIRVRDKTFNTINEASEYANNGDTMYLLNDVTINFEQEFPNGKNILFDLAGHSLIMTNPLRVNGNVTIMDSVGHGSINNLKETTLEINGELVIDQAVIMSESKDAITNKGSLTINDGLIRSNNNGTNGINNSGTLIYNGGEIEGPIGVNNTGTAEINGGSIEGKVGVSIRNTGTLDIYEHAKIENSVSSAIEAVSGTTTVHGGEIKSTNGDGITFNRYSGATVKVEGGSIEGSNNGITTYGGSELEISGGHIEGKGNVGVSANGTSVITGGVIEGATYGVYSSSETTIGEDEGTVSIDEPVIKGELYGLYIERGTLNFYDGILKGITDAYKNEISNIPSRTEIYYDEERIGNYDYKTAYILTETVIAINVETGKEYTNLQDAIDECKTNETVKILANVPLYYEVVNNNDEKVTIDMNGYRITTNKKIINNKNLVIKNNNIEKESFIRTSSNLNLITNTGTLEIENVEVINNSSSNYVINNAGTLKGNKLKVTGINGINSTNSVELENSTINVSYIGINTSNKLTIMGSEIRGGNYSVYSNTNKEINVSDSTITGTYYNQGGNTTTYERVIINSSMQNNGSTLIANGSTFNSSIMNTGTAKIQSGSIINGVVSTNSGTMEITDSEVNSSSNRVITTSGTLTINNSTIKGNRDSGDTRLITNSGVLRIENESKIIAGEQNAGANYMGIYTYGTSNVEIENSQIKVNSNNTGYGMYIDSSNSKIKLKSGKIEVNGSTTYGAYISTGTLEMGEKEEGENAGTENANVSIENPEIRSIGRGIGVGIKKINGSFDFYDGIIWGSRYAKPETTTNVELNYEVTTYVEAETGYEYALLEYMKNDYEGNTVALLNGVYYRSVQAAIDKCEEGDEILLLKSVSEDLTVALNSKVKINLNGHSITTKTINNGELQVYNGSLQNFDESAVINNGTLIIGENDGTVSSTNVRIISEVSAIKNNGTVKMYDGYIQGVPSIEGTIDEIATLSRIYTEKTDQMERKYLQSLSEEAIINKETKLIITIDPNGGVYKGSKDVQEIYLYYHDTYELESPSKNGCEFIEWEITDESVLEENTIRMELSDITVKAKWRVSENAVAHIGNEYYTSVMEAINAAKEKDVIELIKSVEEDVTNNKNVTINLHGNKITGEFINNGELKLLDGTIENPNGIGLVNNKKLNVGENDGEIEVEAVKIIGTSLGLEQNGSFNFYDGYIEGEVAMLGRTDSVPQGYFLYNERVNEKQRVYLIGNPANAVAVIEEGGTQYFFSLQDAINTATVSGSEIFIVRDFEATYPIKVEENAKILINMNSYNITTGNDITNNGELKIYDSSEEIGSITSARPIINNGTLTIEDVNITETNNTNNTITSSAGSTLNIKNSTITAQNGYSIMNEGNLKLEGTFDLESTNFGLYNTGTVEEITSGTIKGIDTKSDLTIGGTLEIIGNGQNSHTAVGVSNGATLTINGASITNNSLYGIYNGESANVIINDGTTINAPTGLYCGRGTSTYTMNGGTITSSSIGVRMQADNCNFTMNDGEVTGVSYGIYTYGYYNEINVNGTVKATNGMGIRDERDKGNTHNNNSKINITGGLVEGTTYGVYVRYSTVTVENAEVKTTSTNRDQYAYYSDYWNILTLNDGAFINAPNASGMRSETTTTMNEGSRIYAGASNGYGIRGHYTVFTMNGGTIETPGENAYGILCNDNYETLLTMNNGEIKSGYIGLGLYDTNSSYDRVFNMKSGSVTGELYGIYVTQNYAITIGHEEDELSISDPVVSGGLYGLYNTSGTANFYNGKLRGYTYGYNDDFNSIRTKMDIAEGYEDNDSVRTVSTENTSIMPISNTAKEGNGYVKITYIGEDSGVCINNQEWTYDYTGSEESFTAPCQGKFKLETWGAQGGSSIYNSYTATGGYGAYSVGEIELTENETLYINVGGKGKDSYYDTTNGIVYGDGIGYNGGGYASYYANNSTYAGGGGATHIATSSGLLSTLKDNKESVLIVAGGGGGSGTHVSYPSYSGDGGSAGGAIGSSGITANNTCYNYGTGGTQTSGGSYTACTSDGRTSRSGAPSSPSFGKGSNYTSNSVNSYCYAGGGGGYFGGQSGWHAPGGGGSSYVGNSRLANKAMYGYNAITEKNTWVVNYLVEREGFLEVDGNIFNSIEDASKYILDNLDGTGTINVIKDATIQEKSNVLEGTTITLNLNGHKLTTTKNIINNANLTITDTSTEKTGMIDCKKDNAITNNGSLTVDGISIKATGNNAIVGNTGTGTILVKNNSNLEGTRGIYITSSQTLNIENTQITATADGIRSDAAANITINEGTIINSSDIGIRLQTDNNKLTVNNGEITGTNYGIYTYGQANEITVNDGTIKANTYDGIRDDRGKSTSSWPTYASKININGGLIQGARYGIYDYYSMLKIKNAEVKTTSTSRDHYAIYGSDWTDNTIDEGAFINAPSASGIYTNSTVRLNEGSVYAGSGSGFGIYGDYTNLIIKGGKIEAPGNNAYGVYLGNYNYKNIEMSGGEITSGYIGVALVNGTSDTRVFRITDGTIQGDTYGIYQTQNFTTTIGNAEAELSTTEPLISGGLYGIYKTNGTVDFYNGRLRGYTYGYNDMFNNVREKKDIVEENEHDSEAVDTKTLVTTNVSSEPTSEYAKIGNGYAKLTYLGETNETCENNQEYIFDYTGDEQSFSAPCAGTYKIEAWGASGGGSAINSTDSSRSGSGGYSTGEIELTQDETLYINVGGQGRYGSGASAFGGPVGGYNGGGNGGNSISCSGGGATHIATASGVLSSLEDNKDSIIIVAGGGGGSDDPGGDSSQGGNGGGYIAGPAYINSTQVQRTRQIATPEYDGGCGMGGTQTEGFAFGQGENVTFNTDTGGAGGGWYGGYVTNNWSGGAGGGSGYIGNSRLTNKAMYGYSIKSNPTDWVNNYLAEKESFIKVNDEVFNSINDAAEYIMNNLDGEGTMVVIKDVTIQEEANIPSGLTGTLDLNGHEIIMSKSLTNNGKLTVTDTSEEKTGIIDNKKTDTIINNNDLIVDGVKIKTSGDAAIWGRTGTGTLELKGNTELEGTRGLVVDSAQKVSVTDTTITTTSDGIRTNAANTNVTINEGTVINAGDLGIRLQNGNTKLTVTDADITGTNYGIYSYGNGNKITINSGNITGTNADGIRDEYNGSSQEIKVLGGTVTGGRYGIYKYTSTLTVENAEVKTTSLNRDHYALYIRWGTTHLNDGAFINAPNASGIWAEDNLYMEAGSKIYAGNTSAYGIAERWMNVFEMNGGEIETPGSNATGFYSYDNLANLTINSGSIKSGNIGIYLNTSGNYARTLTVNGGSISGDTYGIYQVQNYTTTIGNSEDELSTSIPYITGGLYGIYKTNGTVDFYNGRLRGYTYGYYGTINNIREEKIIVEESEGNSESESTLTYSVKTSSTEPIEKTAKQGNGYAKLTYLGENGECTSGQTWEFDYTGAEETFTPTCAGTYSLEVWGAQGGSIDSTYYGGYGAYSYGEISLDTTETLYINVGGRGNVSNTTVVEGGYNGGGAGTGGYCNGYRYGASGGGATHIATTSGLLNTLENNKESILIVAGGGGGSSTYGARGAGGSGGGYKGSDGIFTLNGHSYSQYASGGTQSSGGLRGNSYSLQENLIVGSFGQGGDQATKACSEGSGGGGGYYGGGSAIFGTGAGGSGYIANTRLINKAMYGYNAKITYENWINNYLSDPKQFIINIDQDKTYSNMQKAFNEVEEGDTLQLLDDVSITYDLTTKSDILFTLDMNGYNLETTKQITNTADLKIINTGTTSEDDEIYVESQEDVFYDNGTIYKPLYTENSWQTEQATFESDHISLPTNGYYIVYSDLIELTNYNSVIVKKTDFVPGRARFCQNPQNVDSSGDCINLSWTNIDTDTYVADISNITDSDKKFLIDSLSGENSGNIYYIAFSKRNIDEITTDHSFIDNPTITFKREYSYTGDVQTFTAPENGTYKIEAWGASGTGTSHGNGGYTSGYINLIKDEKLYLYVGANNTEFNTDTFNGSYAVNNPNYFSGGGATDVRLVKDNWDDETSLASRIMVAGGGAGGGAARDAAPEEYIAGSAGGLNGKSSQLRSDEQAAVVSGGTQTSGGPRGVWNGGRAYGIAGTFGIGGKGNPYNTTDYRVGGGGGGGYYGGGSGSSCDGNCSFPGSGGSSYISGYTGSVAVKSATDISPKTGCSNGTTDIECSYHYSGKVFTNTIMVDGDSSMPTHDGNERMIGNDGNGFIKITSTNVKDSDSKLVNYEKSYDYTGNYETFEAPVDGIYEIQTWGAAGGRANSTFGANYDNFGNGGYAKGQIELSKGEKLYVYVGQRGYQGIVGSSAVTPVAFNGGGSGAGSSDNDDAGGSGGGATDIRLVPGEWNDQNSLASRIMVAGGGSGAPVIGYNAGYKGGHGGGLTGTGDIYRWRDSKVTDLDLNATQTTGYQLGVGQNAILGIGCAGSGGGGGYYGGKAQTTTSSCGSAGGGGSSYISGLKGAVAITSAQDTTPKSGCTDGTKDITCSYHYSGKKFIDPETIDGNSSMPTFDGTDKMTGNQDEGHAVITLIKNTTNNKSYSKGYEYTGSEETFVAPYTGIYKLETWGASGGTFDETYHGGYGAYSTGQISLVEGEKLYINVGGTGGCMNAYSNVEPHELAGGYNGGGNATDCTLHTDTSYSCTGGGATHIARESGLLSTFESKKDKLVQVSAGGGGGFYLWSGELHSIGGSGGGIKGSRFIDEDNEFVFTEIKMPDQTSPSIITVAGSDGGTHTSSFGQGYSSCSGGGGGFYGGSSYQHTIGGSSFIGNSSLSEKHMTCYNCETSNEYETKTLTTTDVSETPTPDYAKQGNGYAKITYIPESKTSSTPMEIDSTKWTQVDGSEIHYDADAVRYYRSYANTQGSLSYNDTISFTNDEIAKNSKTVTGDIIYYHDWVDGSSLGTLYVGLATTNENRIDDFVSVLTYDINNGSSNRKNISFEIPTPNKAGEYYFKTVLNHNDATSAYTVVEHITSVNVNTIKNSDDSYKPSKISSTMNTTMFINNGKLDIDNVNLSAYNIVEGSNNSTLTINDSTIRANNKAIISTGDITINNGNITAPYGIETGKNLLFSNSKVRASNQGIINTGNMTIIGSNIIGTNYGIYDNSTYDSTVTNSTIKSSSTAVYKQKASVMTLTDNTIIGSVNNSNASSTLNVSGGNITGTVSNSGISTYTKVPITYTSNYYYEENMINNSGTLYMDESNVTFNSMYASGSGYYTIALNNSGTTTSYKTKYKVNHTNGKYKWMLGIRNTGLLSSTNDEIEIIGAGASYAILNSSTNESTIENINIYSHNNGNEIYAIRNNKGKLNINGGSINMDTNGFTRMIYTSGPSTTVVTDVTASSINNSTDSYAIYMQDDGGTLNIVRGTFNVTSNTNAYIAQIDNGTLEINNGIFSATAVSTGYGLNISDGNVTVEKGTFTINGNNTYGIHMTNGTYTQGIPDNSGFDSADVSITDPHIEAIGTNEGTGISMGNGTFNFYDGIIIGSTRSRVDGDIVSNTDKNYQVKTDTNEQGYSYSILEFIK